MNLAQFRQALADHPDRELRFYLTADSAIAPHFHVTEVGRVEKRFVDCGGVRRSTVACVLQTLVADDVDHRLTTTKLAKIMALADTLELPADAPVEVEHQERSISLDAIDRCEPQDEALVFFLAPKQTECLAGDACGLPVAGSLNVLSNGDCSGTTGCC